jgi:hypothetical protein
MSNRIANDFSSTIAGSVFTKGGEGIIKAPVGHEFVGFTTLANTVIYSKPDFTYPSGRTIYERKDFMQVQTGSVIAYYARTTPKTKVKKILNEFSGAAAAYSLRELSNEVDNVVRVRRSMDNAEKDFTAAEVVDNTLVDFCNFTDKLPANYGAGADRAYSLRYVYEGYSGDVVRVRRTSDQTEQDFNPTEITDGTLESFVGAGNDGFATTWYDQVGFEELSSAYGTSISGTVVGGTDSYTDVAPVSSGNFYRIQWTVSAIQTRGRVRFRNASNGSDLTVLAGQGNLSYFTENGVYTTFVASDAGVSLNFLGDSGQGFTYSNVSVVEIDRIPNDATQTSASAQPKIVDSGSLILESGKPTIDFDGSSDHFIISDLDSSENVSVFMALKPDTNNDDSQIYNMIESSSGSNRHAMSAGQGGLGTSNVFGSRYYDLDTSSDIDTTGILIPATLELFLITNIYKTETEVDFYLDQTSGATANSARLSFTGSAIGGNNSGSNVFDGKISEFVVYLTNREDDRKAIEANINSYYSAFTPATSGFVASWYDQSGNGKTATQSSASVQPKIVDAGSLVTENGKPTIDFDGTNDFLEIESSNSSFNFLHNGTSCSLYAVSKRIQTSSTISLLGNNAGNGSKIGYGIFYYANDSLLSYITRGATGAAVENLSASGQDIEVQHLIFDDIDADNSTASNRSILNISRGVDIKNNTLTNSPSTSNATHNMQIGASGSDGNPWYGNIQEVVIFNVSKSSNQSAIENNVTSHYSI